MSSLKKDVASALGVNVDDVDTKLQSHIVKQAFFQKLASLGVDLSDNDRNESMFDAACSLQEQLSGTREVVAKQAAMQDPINVAISMLQGSSAAKTASAASSQDTMSIVDSLMRNPDTFAHCLVAVTED